MSHKSLVTSIMIWLIIDDSWFVNDELFINDVQQSLHEASSRSFDKVIEKFEYSKVENFMKNYIYRVYQKKGDLRSCSFTVIWGEPNDKMPKYQPTYN